MNGVDYYQLPNDEVSPMPITGMETNTTACICSDLQHEDYSATYALFNYIIIIIALPSLSVFGVITNFINVFVYTRKRMRSSANTYLLYLACSDFMVIVTGLFIFWIDSARSYIDGLANAPYTSIYTLPVGYMAQTCSIYFTVAAAVDCFVHVCVAQMSSYYCTVKKATRIVMGIVICSVIYNSLRFPQFRLRQCFHEPSQEMIVEICPTSLFTMINTIYNIYLYMALMTVLPFMFLLVLNAFIVYRQSRRVNSPATHHTPSNCSTNGSYADAMHSGTKASASGDETITMIMVVVLFLACNTLALVVNIIETFFEPDDLLLNFLTDASNFLVILNSSVNCIIYLVFNKEYRDVFMKTAKRICGDICLHCCRCGIRPPQPRMLVYKPLLKKEKKAQRALLNIDGSKDTHPSLLVKRAIDGEEPSTGPESPVWRQLNRREDVGFWNYCAQLSGTNCKTKPESSYEPGDRTPYVDDDDGDSGWGDSASQQMVASTSSPSNNTAAGHFARSWIAEVKIVDTSPSRPFTRPHIYVTPIAGSGARDTISITAL